MTIPVCVGLTDRAKQNKKISREEIFREIVLLDQNMFLQRETCNVPLGGLFTEYNIILKHVSIADNCTFLIHLHNVQNVLV